MKEEFLYLLNQFAHNFNPEYPNIYRNLKYAFNKLLGRYSWYNA